jgi:peroxiredoxin
VSVNFTLAQEQQQRSERRQRRQAVPGKMDPHPPQVGEEAPDFQLQNLQGETFTLHELTAKSPVVLLVLRGWPGYQCPICSRQVGEFITKQADFTKAGAEVVMIYPGPADLLAEHAKEFQGDRSFPANYHYLIDPDYTFTNAWGLRWEAPRETAYPSTFLIGTDHKIKFGMTSTSHGGRASADTVLGELAKLQ